MSGALDPRLCAAIALAVLQLLDAASTLRVIGSIPVTLDNTSGTIGGGGGGGGGGSGGAGGSGFVTLEFLESAL